MANEISITTGLQVSNGSFKIPKYGSNSLRLTQNAAGGGFPGLVEIGTTEEVLDLTGFVTIPGWVWMKNLDPTNFVQWGPEATGAMVVCGRIEPSEEQLFRLDPSTVLRLKADTAPCKLQILVLED